MIEVTNINMHENIRRKRGHWESFGDIDGLGHECGCLLEDKDGNIWVGTSSGLSRYDGREFIIFTDKDGLANNSVNCIHQDGDRNIWVGTSNGLSRYDGREFANFTDRDGLASNSVNCIHQDRDGNIWIGTSSGLSQYNSEGFTNFTDKDGLAGNDIHCIHQDKNGNLWIGTWHNGLSRYDGKTFVDFTESDGLAGNYTHCIHQDKDGNIWIGTHNGLSRFHNDSEEFVNFTDEDGLPGNHIWCINEDRDGNIWIGTLGDGVICYDGSEFINFNTEYGLAHNDVFDIIQDREGSLWFACYHGGISRYNPYEISSISDESVREVMMQDKKGNLWWGFRNILSQFDGTGVEHYYFEHEIFELFEDSKGQFWVGTDGGGIFRYDSSKKVQSPQTSGNSEGVEPQSLTVDDGLANNRVIRIYEDIQGDIWIGTRGGLSRYNGTEFTNFTTSDRLKNNIVSVIFQDKSRILWFAGWAGGGITRYDGKDFHRYGKDNGLVDDSVICIVEDNKDNLWIGTPSGISCYDGKSFRSYTTDDGLLGSFAQRMIQDSRGQIWIATLGGGVSRFDGINFQALTTEDGLPSNCVTGIVEDSDSNMFISTYRGICKYVPDYETRPFIRIDEVDADRIYKEPVNIEISESLPSLRIKFHGISFKTKRIRYSYILEGYDKDWKATWDEEVRYENLPIGEYRFKVIAINRDLVYSETPAELKLNIVPDTRDRVIGELEAKVAERTRELKEAKDYIDNVVKSMADTLIVVDQNGIIQTVNQATLNLLGYDEGELIGKHIDMILAEAEEELLEESKIDDLIERDFILNLEEGFIRNVGNTYLAKDGRRIPVLFSGSIIQNDNGEMQGIVCMAQDITGRKQMEEELRRRVAERTEKLTKTVQQLQDEVSERRKVEEALRESEKKYRFLYEESPVISFIIGMDGIIKDINRTSLEEFGYAKNEIVGRHAMDFVVPKHRKKVANLLESDFKGEYTPETEIGICAQNGSIHTVLFSPGQAVLYEGGITTGILVTGIDITKRKQAEELARLQQQQLIQAEKMATLGVLSSGVAHEINNPNNFILLNAKIFQRVWHDIMPILEEYYDEHGDFAVAGMPYTQAYEKIGQLISGMSEGSQRIAKIVQGLKDFARQDTGELNQTVDINSVLEAAILIVGNLIKKSTERFSCEYGSNLPKIRGNAQQLEQVIINLITNACQAIDDKEKSLLIATSHDNNSDSVIVEVHDEGAGITPECMKYIMDPFFTTKRNSGGTGLGLSISYNIVKAHRGNLDFMSELGKGTTVILSLPAHQ